MNDWLKRKASIEEVPTIDMSLYPSDWRAWWVSVMPSWRRLADIGDWPLGRQVPTNGEPWKAAYRFGPHGVHQLIVGLFWWKSYVGGSDVQRKEYLSAMEDVLWVLQHLSSLPRLQTHAAATVSLSSSDRAKRVSKSSKRKLGHSGASPIAGHDDVEPPSKRQHL